jgi:hypothetical protein
LAQLRRRLGAEDFFGMALSSLRTFKDRFGGLKGFTSGGDDDGGGGGGGGSGGGVAKGGVDGDGKRKRKKKKGKKKTTTTRKNAENALRTAFNSRSYSDINIDGGSVGYAGDDGSGGGAGFDPLTGRYRDDDSGVSVEDIGVGFIGGSGGGGGGGGVGSRHVYERAEDGDNDDDVADHDDGVSNSDDDDDDDDDDNDDDENNANARGGVDDFGFFAARTVLKCASTKITYNYDWPGEFVFSLLFACLCVLFFVFYVLLRVDVDVGAILFDRLQHSRRNHRSRQRVDDDGDGNNSFYTITSAHYRHSLTYLYRFRVVHRQV